MSRAHGKTNNNFKPNPTHQVVMLTYPNAQILDITGPLEVFARAGRWLHDNGFTSAKAYAVEVVATDTGAVETSSGIKLVAERSYRDVDVLDTFLISGGIGYKQAMEDQSLVAWVKKTAQTSRRVGSICTGALILAQTGLLQGMNVTTHWAYCDELAKVTGNLSVDPDAIFVRNGKFYTSAGVTAGMDMALAMVEKDWGSNVALAVAQELVLFLKRPGGQSQFSRYLQAQQKDSSRLRNIQLWILENLNADLTVEKLAEKALLSTRTFVRIFAQETGSTPAKYVERVRIEAARRLLEESKLSFKSIANEIGYHSEDAMRRAFTRLMGISPTQYRQRFGQ